MMTLLRKYQIIRLVSRWQVRNNSYSYTYNSISVIIEINWNVGMIIPLIVTFCYSKVTQSSLSHKPYSNFSGWYKKKCNWFFIFFFYPEYLKAFLFCQILYLLFRKEPDLKAVYIIDSFIYFYPLTEKKSKLFDFNTLLISENIKWSSSNENFMLRSICEYTALK